MKNSPLIPRNIANPLSFPAIDLNSFLLNDAIQVSKIHRCPHSTEKVAKSFNKLEGFFFAKFLLFVKFSHQVIEQLLLVTGPKPLLCIANLEA